MANIYIYNTIIMIVVNIYCDLSQIDKNFINTKFLNNTYLYYNITTLKLFLHYFVNMYNGA